MMKFRYRVQNLLAERGEILNDLHRGVGVSRQVFYNERSKRKATIAAVAYYLGMSAEELVAGTDAEEAWYAETGEY